jgi:hypothetical protein
MATQAYQAQSSRLNQVKQVLKSALSNFRENPQKIAELLAFQNRFWNYSLNNSILIQQQNPYATFVASIYDWNKKGCRVKKGQHGIKIFYPIRTELIPLGEKEGEKRYRRVADATPEEKKKIASGELKTVTYTRFGVGTVFDISQTDCPPEDYPRFYDMGYSSKQHAELYQAVKQFAESKGIPVKEEDLQSISLRGAFYPKENMIRINDKLNDTERLSTLTHELGHALMHKTPEDSRLPEPVKEIEADAVSIMLQQYFGIPLTDSRKRHFSENYKACTALKDFKLENVLKRVNATYQKLRKEMQPMFAKIPPDNEKKQLPVNAPVLQPKYSRDSLDCIKKIPMLTIAQDMGYTPVKTGGYYSLKEHDSIRIYPETNSYYQFSAGTGGSPIDFVMHLGGYSKEGAIKVLKEQYADNRTGPITTHYEKQAPQGEPPEKKEFILPEKVQGKYAHAFAYLVKTRCIDKAIVNQCIKDGLIYEDNKHNVVFVGKDEHGNAAYATKHTTLTSSSFKCDVAGSRQDIGWMVKSPKAEKLYVCEAPIDALSIMTLMKQQNKTVNRYDYLATCGTGKDKALYTRLQENPQIGEVVLANDNDEAGKGANLKIYNILRKKFPRIQVKLLQPTNGKDINECLCKRPKKDRNMEQEVKR